MKKLATVLQVDLDDLTEASYPKRQPETRRDIAAAQSFPFAADLSICRILNGMWQVSGAHGAIDPARAVEAMFAYHDAGFTTWDLADHYGPAEDFIGAFRRQFAARHGAARLGEIQAFTKWVPLPGPMTRRVVEEAVAISLRRMGVDRLDLLQFHWWDYGDRRYLDALRHLADLREEGRIRHLGLTNFDTERLADHRRARHPDRLEPGAVFARRSASRRAHGGVVPRARRQLC